MVLPRLNFTHERKIEPTMTSADSNLSPSGSVSPASAGWRDEMESLLRELQNQGEGLTVSEILPILSFHQRSRWQSGVRIPAEAYLDLLSRLPDGGDCVFEVAYGEYLLRQELSEQPVLQDYLKRFPQCESKLRRQIELHQALGTSASAASAQAASAATIGLPEAGQGTATESLPSLPGYEIVCELGRGAMGRVYKALHRSLQRTVAIKVIHAAYETEANAIVRFQREAQAAALVSHPNIVAVYDAGQHGGLRYLVMEYVHGIDLERLVEQSGPLAVEQVRDFARQAALGLQHAFERGLVHRDIKPSNLIVTPPPGSDAGLPTVVKILDMGLARLNAAGSGESLASLTGGGMIGTPNFIAPEQILDAHRADIRADLYSLGCTLYFLLTGRVPFGGRSVIETLDMQRWQTPRPIPRYRPEVPAGLVDVVTKLMAKKPDERYQTPAALAEALAVCLQPRPKTVAPAPAPAAEKDKESGRYNRPALIKILKLELADKLEKNDLARARQIVERVLLLDPKDADALAAQEFLHEAQAAASKEPCRVFKGHSDAVTGVAFVDGRRFLSGSRDQSVRLWDVASGRELRSLTGHEGPINGVAISPDGRLALAGGENKIVHMWEVDTGKEQRRFKGFRGAVNGVAFAADGRHALSASREKVAHLWDMSTGKDLRHFRHAGEVLAVAAAPRSSRAITVGRDATGRLWSLGDSREICRFRKPPGTVITCVAIAPDDNSALFGCSDNLIHHWDLRSESELCQLAGHTGGVTSVAFSPDGTRVLSGSRDRTVRLWDAATGRQLARLDGHTGEVNSVAFSPNGLMGLSGSSDKTIRLWNLPE
jgi:serine/threonine protein kinase/WD40 repeat protein